MSEDARNRVKLHNTRNSGKKYKVRGRFRIPVPYRFQARYVQSLERLLMQCEKVKTYSGPISRWVWARLWLNVKLYGVAERIQDIRRTSVAYIAQIFSAGTALWWAFCLLIRPGMLGTSPYLKDLAALGTTNIIAVMIAMGIYQIGSVLFGPSPKEVQTYMEAGRYPYPGTKFILTAVGLGLACGIWAYIAFLTHKSGGINVGMGAYVGLSALQVVAVIQIGYVFNVAHRDAQDKQLAQAKAVLATAVNLLPDTGAASTSTPAPLPMVR